MKLGSFPENPIIQRVFSSNDCCTVFTPKHPKTKPIPAEVAAAQEAFDFEPLIAEAVANTELKQMKIDV